jgi:hypothetical protein
MTSTGGGVQGPGRLLPHPSVMKTKQKGERTTESKWLALVRHLHIESAQTAADRAKFGRQTVRDDVKTTE